MQRPRGVREPIKPVLGDVRFDLEIRRMGQADVAVELPQKIFPERILMNEERMAGGVALGPVANLVQIDHPERATHADEGAKVDECVFEPARAGEAAVDE